MPPRAQRRAKTEPAFSAGALVACTVGKTGKLSVPVLNAVAAWICRRSGRLDEAWSPVAGRAGAA